MKQTMNCAIYIRVSTTEQAEEGFSISAQKQRLMAFAQSQDWNIVGLYPDEGLSAKDTNRRELKRMITDIQNGLIDVVLVYKLDRLTRSVLDLYKLLQLFEKHDCKFKSATEVYDTTTAIGRLFLTLVAALAQWERENLGERVRMGIREKVRQGNFANSRPPLGYDYDRAQGHLVINDVESALVNEIFHMYLSGLGFSKIAAELGRRKIKTKRFGNYNWHQVTIRSIVGNPIYVGKVRWGVRTNKDDYFTADDPSLRIMDDELFNRVQAVREARSHYKGRAATSTYIFSGVLRCAECGATMFGKLSGTGKGGNTQITHSYNCDNRKYHKCSMSSISERILENNFIDYFKNMDLKKQMGQAVHEMKKSETSEKRKITRLKNELEAIKNRRKKWQYAWSNDMINDNDFTSRMTEEKENEEVVVRQLNELHEQSSENNDSSRDAIAQLSAYIEHWNELDPYEKKQLLQILVKKIVVLHHNAKHYKDRCEIKEIVFN